MVHTNAQAALGGAGIPFGGFISCLEAEEARTSSVLSRASTPTRLVFYTEKKSPPGPALHDGTTYTGTPSKTRGPVHSAYAQAMLRGNVYEPPISKIAAVLLHAARLIGGDDPQEQGAIL